MQTANILVDLGGDTGNQVPKLGVTAAEIAVLIAIHGEAAVHDIEPAGDVEAINVGEGDVKWTNRVELNRLHRRYGKAKDGENNSIVSNLFPGTAARVFETIDELGLPEVFFKPVARAKMEDPAPVAVDPLDHDGNGKKGGAKKPAKKAKAAPAPEPEPEVVEEADEGSDGIEDMPDAEKNLFE